VTLYSRQRAEDVYLFHCYLYYCCHHPIMPDAEFDLMHSYFLRLFPDSPILNKVGSDNPADYPLYIVRGRRPLPHERRH
jgi:hypothetical protein